MNENKNNTVELIPTPELKENLDQLVFAYEASGWRQEEDHWLVYKAEPILDENGKETDAFREIPVKRVSNNPEEEEAWAELAKAKKNWDIKPKDLVAANEKLQEVLEKTGKLVTLRKGSEVVTCSKQMFDGAHPSAYQVYIKKGFKEIVPVTIDD